MKSSWSEAHFWSSPEGSHDDVEFEGMRLVDVPSSQAEGPAAALEAGSRVPEGNSAEEVRNRLLRRVDFRFLLPNPNPDKAVCFAGDPLFTALKLISRRAIDGRDRRGTNDADLAVAVDPDSEILELALRSLRPGGFFYSEWHGLFRHGTSRLRDRLDAAGFEEPTFYWPRPDPSVANPLAWIPLQGEAAIRYYVLENRGQSRTALRRAARRMVRATSAALPKLRLSRPICALARRPTAASNRDDSGLERWIAGYLSDSTSGLAAPSLSCLLLTGGQRSNSKVILLVFEGSHSRPSIAIKMPRTPESSPAVEREASILSKLTETLGASAPPGIPRFLFLQRRGVLPALGETAITGVPLLSAWTRENYQDLALQASSWLAALAERRPPRDPKEWWPRLVAPVVQDFADSFGRATDPVFLREIEARLKTLPPLPSVCEQRDFSPWNVLLTPEGELVVTDWESAELDGLPGLDLIYFLTYLCFSFDSARLTGRYRESYRGMLDRDTPLGSLSARCLSLYRERVRLDEAAVHPLRLLTWLVHARSEYHRLLSDHGQEMTRETLRGAVCVQLLEEELRLGEGGRRPNA